MKKPGTRMTTAGLVIAALGMVLAVMASATTHSDYVPGLGNVETQGSPSAVSIIMVTIGLVLAGIGFARRLLAAAERR